MVFSSHLFLFYFLPFALALYYGVPKGLRMPALTLASYVFYGWTNPWFTLLLFWSTLVDFTCGNLIYGHWRLAGGPMRWNPDGSPQAPGAQRRLALALSLLSNIGMLSFFKYFNFAVLNVNRLLSALGKGEFESVTVLLPAGISFYTFESLSYVLDIYYGRAKPASVWAQESAGPARSFGAKLRRELGALGAFACYITQFPHLVAGPIIRYQDLERQLHRRDHTVEKFGRGVFFFALGFAKKVLLANPAGEVADAAFGAGTLHAVDAWAGLLGYSFQIYFDFSGYSDMAIGLGLLFGFEFAKNFDSPYKSQSITEFWRRWHISLSTWLRDYLYIPLGGNRKGDIRTYANLLVVMLLGGFWHGASWNFLVWGAVHGAWLCLERLLGKTSLYANAPAALRVLLTFFIVNLAWVFFRTPDLPSAFHYLASLLGLGDAGAASLLVRGTLYSADHVLAILCAAGIAFFGVQTWDLSKRVTPLRAALAMALLVSSAVALSGQGFNPFLYFQF
jgi:alginate O-acetyltransferase complex protein AlgI